MKNITLSNQDGYGLNKYIGLGAGLLTGLSIVLYAVSLILFNEGAPIIMATFIFYLLLGVLALIIGFELSAPSMKFIYAALALIFLYFVGLGVVAMMGGMILSGISLITGGLLILAPIFRRKSIDKVDRLVTYFYLTGVVLAYVGLYYGASNSNVIELSTTYIIFFASYTSLASVILYLIILMMRGYVWKYPLGREALSFLTYVTFIIYGVGEVYLGGFVVSSISPPLTNRVGVLLAGGVVGLIAGLLVILSALIAIYTQYKRLQPMLQQIKVALGPYIQPQEVT